jgi:hypothetical protein
MIQSPRILNQENTLATHVACEPRQAACAPHSKLDHTGYNRWRCCWPPAVPPLVAFGRTFRVGGSTTPVTWPEIFIPAVPTATSHSRRKCSRQYSCLVLDLLQSTTHCAPPPAWLQASCYCIALAPPCSLSMLSEFLSCTCVFLNSRIRPAHSQPWALRYSHQTLAVNREWIANHKILDVRRCMQTLLTLLTLLT